MGFSAARLARIAPWYQGLTTNVADGSKGEILAKSKCLPLCHQHQTFIRNAVSQLNLRCRHSLVPTNSLNGCEPSMPVGGEDAATRRNWGKANVLWSFALKIGSNLCCQAHEKNAA
jgi:hypothetical protein